MSKRKASPAETPEPAKQAKTSEIDAAATIVEAEEDEFHNEGNGSTIHPGLSDYEVQRLKNIEHHAKLFESLQLGDARNALAAVSYQKQKVNQVGIKKTRQEPWPLLPTRVSIRLLAKRSCDSHSKSPKSFSSWEAEPTEYQSVRERNPPGPLPLKATNCSDSDEHKKLVEKLVEAMRMDDFKITDKQPRVLRDLEQYGWLLQTLSLNERRVAKVVPDRITSLAFHPLSASPIVAAGDKWGRLGIWQVGLGGGDDGVFLFEPHIQPLTCLKYGVNRPELLFSASYDSTVRCMDLNKEVFDEVFSLPEVGEVRFHCLSFASGDSTSLFISCSDGTVRAVDTRAARKRCPKYTLHTRSVKCIDVHPVDADYFVTSSTDSCVAVWDKRYLKGPSSHVARTNHFKQVDSAYFSSLTGNKILSTSTDNTIRISSFEDKKELNQLKSVRHDNQTGRWLTNFKATWDPKRDDVFIVGSMKRPRQVEVWGSNGSSMALLHHDLLNSVNSLNCFHPSENWIVGGNSSGRVFVWM